MYSLLYELKVNSLLCRTKLILAVSLTQLYAEFLFTWNDQRAWPYNVLLPWIIGLYHHVEKKCGQPLSILWCSILTPTCLNIFSRHWELCLTICNFVMQRCYRHHQHGRWQARIGRVAGNKDLYLGTFSEYIYNSISPSSKMTKTFVMDCCSFFFFAGTQEEAAEAYDIAAIKFRGLNAVTNFDMSRYDVNSILESSTLPIGGAAKRLKDAEQAEMTIDGQRTDDEMSSQLTDGINNYGAHHHGWPTVAFQQAQPFSMHYPYGHQQRAVWCKQEQDPDATHNFQDLHQLQLGNTHNFFQPNVLHNLMSMDSSSMDHSSGSNSVIYSGGGAADGSAATGGSGSGSFQGVGYGNNIGFVMPISTVIAHEGGHGQGNGGFGDSEVKAIGYDNMFGSTDPYHARSLYYLSQQSSAGMVKGSSAYDQGSGCNNWVPTAVPTLAPRTNSLAVCHGTPTFTVWNDT